METAVSFLKFVFTYRKKVVEQVMFYVSMVCALTVVVHVGYITNPDIALKTELAIRFMFYMLFVLELIRKISSILILKKITVSNYSSIFLILYFLFIIVARLTNGQPLAFFAKEEWLYLGIALVFLSELSKNSLFFDNFYFNPTILFVISFLSLILVGTILLMLPRTTLIEPLSFVDAFFMATSAVCITGLTVTDISTNFSLFGQGVIMLLVQVGGLGIMTFTGFFGYFFSGGFSFKNQLMFGEILGENKLNAVISTLLTIIFITLLFEFIGGVFIYISVEDAVFDSLGEKIFFCAFHAISSFCNSGFTIIKDGLMNDTYRYNYNFQIALSLLFVIGSLGFSTIFNFYTYVKDKLRGVLGAIFFNQKRVHRPQSFSFNTKFILSCNMIVLVLATGSYFVMEQNQTLMQDRTVIGEWVTSFFMANASRSAGFNSVDPNLVTAPTLIMLTTLMWIGTAPGSTGGGVKVTTVAIALMNIFSLARGKDSLEIYRRSIAAESVNKAFAIIILSLITITLSFILLSFTEPEQKMKILLFETVSAYTTCGLSLGATPSLSSPGKIIIVFTMFVGRVGTLTLLVAFIKNIKNKSYIYPAEKILF
ncbi:ATPase [Sphingobacterium alkalisoli]|uniref:ATPase n=1 Tax=Sphingobacterium alkalisoli TaxID=1874115 RepID=A0A4U0GSD9_9SPHI|nr:potassium transporter TrkG [Sphingobacterium alkalisoli]TJY61374.1 ATPase [Sphingobacterium alkalisoli]GGH31179.1 potassium transporter [Sphingobacterium alkalisoli]